MENPLFFEATARMYFEKENGLISSTGIETSFGVDERAGEKQFVDGTGIHQKKTNAAMLLCFLSGAASVIYDCIEAGDGDIEAHMIAAEKKIREAVAIFQKQNQAK